MKNGWLKKKKSDREGFDCPMDRLSSDQEIKICILSAGFWKGFKTDVLRTEKREAENGRWEVLEEGLLAFEPVLHRLEVGFAAQEVGRHVPGVD